MGEPLENDPGNDEVALKEDDELSEATLIPHEILQMIQNDAERSTRRKDNARIKAIEKSFNKKESQKRAVTEILQDELSKLGQKAQQAQKDADDQAEKLEAQSKLLRQAAHEHILKLEAVESEALKITLEKINAVKTEELTEGRLKSGAAPAALPNNDFDQ